MQIGGGQNRLKADTRFKHSHTLPKIAISLALLLGSANIALAEEGGGFVGFGIGGGGTAVKFEIGGDSRKQTRNGLNYGFVGGYKQFFNDYLGLRYYVNVDLHHNMSKVSGKVLQAIIINYGVNVDFLGNFVATEMVDFGGFVGVGLGGDSWFGGVFDDYLKSWQLDDSISAETNSWKLKKTSF